MKRLKSKGGIAGILLAVMLALGLLLGGVGTAFAVDVPKWGDDPANETPKDQSVEGALLASGDVYIKKTLNIAPGVATPDEEFKFVATLVGVVDHTINPAPSPDPYAAIRTLEVGAAPMPANDGTGAVSSLTAVGLAGMTFPHAGVYTYNVTEDESAATPGMQYNIPIASKATYTMQVYVKNSDAGLVVYAATVIPGTKTHIGSGDDGDKVVVDNNLTDNGFVFTNSYAPPVKLDITKATEGAFADLTQKFSVSVEITVPATTPAGTVITVSGGTFPSDATSYTFTNAGTASVTATGSLKNGETMHFEGLPAGTTYKVIETGSPNYTATATVQEGGVSATANQGTTGSNYTVTIGSRSDLVATVSSDDGATNENVTAITNTYSPINITGLITDNLPFIAIGVLAIAGFALYLLGRMRRSNDDE